MPHGGHEHHEHHWHDPSWKEWIAIAVMFLAAVAIAVVLYRWVDAYTSPQYEPPVSPFRQVQVGGSNEH